MDCNQNKRDLPTVDHIQSIRMLINYPEHTAEICKALNNQQAKITEI